MEIRRKYPTSKWGPKTNMGLNVLLTSLALVAIFILAIVGVVWIKDRPPVSVMQNPPSNETLLEHRTDLPAPGNVVEPTVNAGIGDILQNPEKVMGEVVVIDAKISTAFNPRAFSIRSGDKEILVFVTSADARKPWFQRMEEEMKNHDTQVHRATVGSQVKITGVVTKFSKQTIARYTDKSVEEAAYLEGNPILEAQKIEFLSAE